MKVLVTGAYGNVGYSTVQALLRQGYQVRTFDLKNQRNTHRASHLKGQIEVRWGDLRNIGDVGEAVKGCDLVIHLGAIIPPLADRQPLFAWYVNVGGTENILRAIKQANLGIKLIFSSSIAVYGDRLQNPRISCDDPVCPNPEDEYARQKLQCEELIRDSGLNWAIFRLTYIVSPEKLKMDPLMFSMPLETSLEICNSQDAGLALANAVGSSEVWGKTLHLAGGGRCRISYRHYLSQMFELFGLGRKFLPEAAFSRGEFHCGFMDTRESEQYLHYQQHNLRDYFQEVAARSRLKRLLITLFRPLARHYLLRRSPFL